MRRNYICKNVQPESVPSSTSTTMNGFVYIDFPSCLLQRYIFSCRDTLSRIYHSNVVCISPASASVARMHSSVVAHPSLLMQLQMIGLIIHFVFKKMHALQLVFACAMTSDCSRLHRCRHHPHHSRYSRTSSQGC